jgi:hypothetical protein
LIDNVWMGWTYYIIIQRGPIVVLIYTFSLRYSWSKPTDLTERSSSPPPPSVGEASLLCFGKTKTKTGRHGIDIDKASLPPSLIPSLSCSCLLTVAVFRSVAVFGYVWLG